MVLLDVNEPFIKELEDFLEDYNNPSVFSNVEINGMSFKTGYIIVSSLNSTEHVHHRVNGLTLPIVSA
ncbi:hypothetical protein BGP_0202 [Beggiatoa sp. PS]|nr:hypothetical protein BGP_0202 [Beggiatoa sp. PS]